MKFGCVFLLMVCGDVQASINLTQSFEAAQKRSEDLANQSELVTQAEARYSQAIGAVLPTVNFVSSYLRQAESARAGILSPSDQRINKVTATQPLFRGFREYAALKQQSILVEGQSLLREQAYLQLYQDTTQSFFQVIMAEQDYENLKTELMVAKKRLKDVVDFKKIGRSRASEVLGVQSTIAALEAQMEGSRTQLSNYRSLFSFMTGVDSKEILLDSEPLLPKPNDLNFYLNKVSERPDVKSAEKMLLASEKSVTIARGGHLPTLDLNGNYYLERYGFLSDVHWDVGLLLNFPIFQGGVISSQVSIAASQQKQSELALSKVKRLAIQQIETTYAQLEGDLALIEKQKALVSISTQSYQEVLKDYRYGLVTNMEVLLALTTSQESKRGLDRIQSQLKIDYHRLLAQVSDLPKGTK